MSFSLKKIIFIFLVLAVSLFVTSCKPDPTEETIPTVPINGWDGQEITYQPNDLVMLDAATPQGYAILNASDNNQSVIIKSLSPELDNYGGIATGVLTLDFNYAVIFQMDVVSVYSQYIVKLFVEGENDSFYVLSDDGTPGLISVNVVDSMLSDKYREKGTLPDPGYANGWKYDNQKKNCYFYIMPKGPDGEIRTAELIIRSIRVTNFNAPSVEQISITGDGIADSTLTRLKSSQGVTLQATVTPTDVHDASIRWSSADESIATISETGVVQFVGVGITQVYATSVIDQSKKGSINVNVTSGYENKNDITTYLSGLNIQGSGLPSSQTLFDDLFKTTWAAEATMSQKIQKSPLQSTLLAVTPTIANNKLLLENYFNPELTSNTNEAQLNMIGTSGAGLNLELAGNNANYTQTSSATIYRKINNMIYKETFSSTNDIMVSVRYALLNGSAWSKASSYTEDAIVVWGNGEVTKYQVIVKAVTLIKLYTASDLLNTLYWQDGNTLILAPGSIRDNGNGTVTIREENPTKYPYGGMISELLTIDKTKQIEIVLDITETNPTRVLWDLRLLYFVNSVRKGNPLKIDSSNQTGRFTLNFVPVEETFRIFLIANGSDIGVIAEGAEIKLRSLKIQYVDA
jgi:hypothetical protein